jgi:hypothetical protein
MDCFASLAMTKMWIGPDNQEKGPSIAARTRFVS